MDLAAAYRRSAYPAMGISFAVATADPALRATLELAHWMRCRELRRLARRAERMAVGKWISQTQGQQQ